ncbi:uncharacterized protein ACNS7B_019357 [Menidia menidia]
MPWWFSTLVLLSLGPACGAFSLGLTVHVVPLEKTGGKTVRAHFSVLAPLPCPDLSSICSEGEDCVSHPAAPPLTGASPPPGWCLRQWQKTVPSTHTSTLRLGSRTDFYVSIKADPKIRENSGRLNQPAFVALPPPLRARVNCPQRFPLAVKDLDGDRVRCRFAKAEEKECEDCPPHSFLELDQDKCSLTFTGKSQPGKYLIYLMAEDLIPVPKSSQNSENAPLSAVPVHLYLTVEQSALGCSGEPLATDGTPKHNSVLFVLPFQEEKFTVSYNSEQESVSEIAVVGPPELFRTGFASIGPLAKMTVAWIRSENQLTRLLPVCFLANTDSFQSESRCVWLYQREMRTLPAGTELKCEKTEMTLVLPVSSLSNINLSELQLNSPTCPVTFNQTHLAARIPLTGCGTKTVHSGSELVYTNTLQSVRRYSLVSRRPSLVLPLACRLPGVQVKGPHLAVGMPSERETFGEVRVWLEFHLPGKGPLSKFTRVPRFRTDNLVALGRARREVETLNEEISLREIGSKIQQLDLHVMSNCSVDRAEMVVSKCVESETEDFSDKHSIMDKGCMMSNSSLEIVTSKTNSKVYRLDLSTMATSGTTMFVECSVNLCITTMPSDRCPDLCGRSAGSRTLVGSVFTSMYTVRSGPVSLVVTTPAPTVLTPASTTTNTPTDTAQTTIRPTDTAQTTIRPTDTAQTTIRPTDTAQTTIRPTDTAQTTIRPTDTTQTTIRPTDNTQTTIRPTDTTQTTIRPTDTAQTTIRPTDDTLTTIRPTESSQTSAKPTDSTQTTTKPIDAPQTTITTTTKPTDNTQTTTTPTTTTPTTTKTTTTPATTSPSTTSHAPKMTTSVFKGVFLLAIGAFLQKISFN